MSEGLTSGKHLERRAPLRAAYRWDRGGRIGLTGLSPDAALPFIVPTLIFVLWVVAARLQWMSPQVLPTPLLVWQTAGELASQDLFRNLLISLERLAAGFAIAVAAGIALGMVMGLSRRAEAILYPTFIAIVQIPTLAWIPLLMMLLGLGEALKIVVIVKAVITPVTIYTHIGVRDADPRLIDVARALRLSARSRLARLILPASLPSLMTGLKLGLAQGWTSLLAVELLASSEGIGFLMVWGRQLFQLDIVFVCIAVIGGVGLLLDRALGGLDRRLVGWPRLSLAAHRRHAGGSDGGWQLILPVLLFTLWSLAGWAGWATALVPTPLAAVRVFALGLADGSLGHAMARSLERSFAGLALGGGAGLAVGLAMGLFPLLHRLLNATLTTLRLVAIFAWIPLLTAWAGLGDGSKVTFVAIASFFPMQVAAERGVANLSPQLAEAARALRFDLGARLRYFILPGITPSVFAGLRLALLQSWIGAMGAEYFMPSGGGIGSLMVNAQQLFRMDQVVAAMFLVGVVAVLLNGLGRRLETRATRWRQA